MYNNIIELNKYDNLIKSIKYYNANVNFTPPSLIVKGNLLYNSCPFKLY